MFAACIIFCLNTYIFAGNILSDPPGHIIGCSPSLLISMWLITTCLVECVYLSRLSGYTISIYNYFPICSQQVVRNPYASASRLSTRLHLRPLQPTESKYGRTTVRRQSRSRSRELCKVKRIPLLLLILPAALRIRTLSIWLCLWQENWAGTYIQGSR
jgi:hypothetical protein